MTDFRTGEEAVSALISFISDDVSSFGVVGGVVAFLSVISVTCAVSSFVAKVFHFRK